MTREVTEPKTIKRDNEVHLIGKVRSLTEFQDQVMPLRSLVNKCPASICFRDIGGNLILVNDNFARIFGLDGDAVIGKKDLEILPAGILAALRMHDDVVLKERTSVYFEHELNIGNEKSPIFA